MKMKTIFSLAILIAALPAVSVADVERTFGTPEEAAQALAKAAGDKNREEPHCHG